MVSNAVARRMMHRPLLVYRMPTLMVIDGIPVTEEEKAKAELYFMDQQVKERKSNQINLSNLINDILT